MFTATHALYDEDCDLLSHETFMGFALDAGLQIEITNRNPETGETTYRTQGSRKAFHRFARSLAPILGGGEVDILSDLQRA